MMPTNGIHLFDIAGFRIRVDPSWLFIAALMVWNFYSTVLPEAAPGLAPMTYFIMAVSLMLSFFIGLVIHELAHSLMARRFGLKVGGISLFIFGGIAELTEEPHDARSDFWIAVAGPVATLVIAAACQIAARGLAHYDTLMPARVVIEHLGLFSLGMAIFNLVPAFPLDGGRMLRAAIWKITQEPLRATAIAAGFGVGFAWLLIVLGLAALFSAGDLAGLWLVLIGVFLMTLAQGSRSEAILRRHLGGRTIASVMSRDPVTSTPEASVADVVDTLMLANGLSFLPVCDQSRVVGVLDAAAIRGLDRDLWASTRVDQIMEPIRADLVVEPDAASEQVLTQMARTGRRKLLVMRQGRLAGVVTLADLLQFVGLARFLGSDVRKGNTRPRRKLHATAP